jgi:negative elongation factor B
MPGIRIGLDALGLQDSQHLKNSLINCDDPLKAIAEFQEENSVLLPTLKSALNLLDLHNVRRLDFHVSIADELKDQLTKRVEELTASINSPTTSKEQLAEDQRKLEELLNKSFPLIS